MSETSLAVQRKQTKLANPAPEARRSPYDVVCSACFSPSMDTQLRNCGSFDPFFESPTFIKRRYASNHSLRTASQLYFRHSSLPSSTICLVLDGFRSRKRDLSAINW